MTLVEMLVVLAIIGIATGTTVLAMGAGHDGGGQAAAQRLVNRIQLAADTAMVDDADLALAVTPTSYAVVERRAAGAAWQPATTGDLGDVESLAPGMQLSAPDGYRQAGARLLPLDADAAGRPFAVTLAQGARQWTISFDGMRAHLQAPGAAAPPGGAS